MRKFNIASYGVEEMTRQEMKKTEGGFWVEIGWLIVGLIVGEALDRNAKKDFFDGVKDAGYKFE